MSRTRPSPAGSIPKRSRIRRTLLPIALRYCVALLVLGAWWSGADWAFRAVIWTFLAALLADSFLGVSRSPGNAGQSPGGAPTDAVTRALTWPWLLVQVALIVTGILAVTRGDPIYATAVAIGTRSSVSGSVRSNSTSYRTMARSSGSTNLRSRGRTDVKRKW